MRHHKHRRWRRGKRKGVVARHDEQKRRARYVANKYGDEGMRMCGSKMAYATQADALVAATVNARYAASLRVYRCPICGKWHLTSKA
jgi:hypothetical protein